MTWEDKEREVVTKERAADSDGFLRVTGRTLTQFGEANGGSRRKDPWHVPEVSVERHRRFLGFNSLK